MTLTLNDPIALGGIDLKNRLIMAPMQQYMGTPEAFAINHHIEHYSRRARHVGLVILESTAVSSNGRLWKNDIGIFTDRHVEPLRKITDAIHAHQTPVFVQLSHGGRKSSPEVTNSLVAPSAIAFDDHYGTPESLSLAGIERIIEEYRLAAKRSIEAGFDGIEIHAAHGFLIHQFCSLSASSCGCDQTTFQDSGHCSRKDLYPQSRGPYTRGSISRFYRHRAPSLGEPGLCETVIDAARSFDAQNDVTRFSRVVCANLWSQWT